MFEDYSKERILRHFEVDPTIGLTGEEVQKRRSQYGENRLEEKKKDSLIKTFFSNFKDPKERWNQGRNGSSSWTSPLFSRSF